jgi:hypothetical protein
MSLFKEIFREKILGGTLWERHNLRIWFATSRWCVRRHLFYQNHQEETRKEQKLASLIIRNNKVLEILHFHLQHAPRLLAPRLFSNLPVSFSVLVLQTRLSQSSVGQNVIHCLKCYSISYDTRTKILNNSQFFVSVLVPFAIIFPSSFQ